MGVLITYYVHGTTTDNEQNIATGWLQGSLSGTGVQQSQDLAKQVAEKKFDAIFCSDLKRAIDSAKLVFGKRYEPIHDRRLREANYGDWNGQHNIFKDHLEKYIVKSFPNGESYLEVEERMRDFTNSLKTDYNNKRVAIVAHQAPQLALEVIASGKTWEEAIADDWRTVGTWQPGWEYSIS